MSKLQLKNVRLSFPSLFHKAVFKEVVGKYEATFLIPKTDTRTKKLLDKAIADELVKAKVKVASDRRCLKDGDTIFNKSGDPYGGYPGHWTFKAGRHKRPTVINRDKTTITEEDEIIYEGCYVNAIVDIWIQDNEFGRRVSANLYGVQFFKDGEPLGAGNIDVTDDFDDLDDDI